MNTVTENSVLEKIEKVADVLADDAVESDRLGRLSAVSEQALRSTGVCRMLQPKDYGGLESHPREFMEAVLRLGSHSPSTGWVAGVVGVHPHELALGSREVQEEVWGRNPETWIASPYAPMGRARPVEGGYVLNGRWPFSSGTDLCQWVMIGGLVTDQDGGIAEKAARHFVLPRSDYEIVADSWKVVGLRGTGSKDLMVRDAFVPAHRVIETAEITDGTAHSAAGRSDSPLYAMPRNVMFAGAVTAATLGASLAVLGAYTALTRDRESRSGKSSRDPYQLAALGECAADIDASVRHFLGDIDRIFDMCAAGVGVPLSVRAEVRRNQVRASNRAAAAADKLFRIAGGISLRTDLPLERLWRDSQAAVHHVQNVQDPILQAYGLDFFGHPIPPSVKF
ncbi:acyl-CoA dehydrogenase family protein [Streptomyces sp. NPDC052042]|uniref:acyl-CoA dehydrogenase family protein n=1 Tax=Streptomyces sp. NPDC052042 TaxID=3365683 RepID=UPI0037D561FD